MKKDIPDKFDRQHWKIMQLAMTDVPKFVDMLHNVPWEDGLPPDTREGSLSYLTAIFMRVCLLGDRHVLYNSRYLMNVCRRFSSLVS